MTEKRFEVMPCKGVWDNSIVRNRELTHDEVIDTLNNFQELSIDDLTKIEKLEKQVGSKQKHIVHLEDKIHRMRKQIHKLENLYHYRTVEIERNYITKRNIYEEILKRNDLSIDWEELCNYKSCFFDEPKPCKDCRYFKE